MRTGGGTCPNTLFRHGVDHGRNSPWRFAATAPLNGASYSRTRSSVVEQGLLIRSRRQKEPGSARFGPISNLSISQASDFSGSGLATPEARGCIRGYLRDYMGQGSRRPRLAGRAAAGPPRSPAFAPTRCAPHRPQRPPASSQCEGHAPSRPRKMGGAASVITPHATSRSPGDPSHGCTYCLRRRGCVVDAPVLHAGAARRSVRPRLRDRQRRVVRIRVPGRRMAVWRGRGSLGRGRCPSLVAQGTEFGECIRTVTGSYVSLALHMCRAGGVIAPRRHGHWSMSAPAVRCYVSDHRTFAGGHRRCTPVCSSG